MAFTPEKEKEIRSLFTKAYSDFEKSVVPRQFESPTQETLEQSVSTLETQLVSLQTYLMENGFEDKAAIVGESLVAMSKANAQNFPAQQQSVQTNAAAATTTKPIPAETPPPFVPQPPYADSPPSYQTTVDIDKAAQTTVEAVIIDLDKLIGRENLDDQKVQTQDQLDKGGESLYQDNLKLLVGEATALEINKRYEAAKKDFNNKDNRTLEQRMEKFNQDLQGIADYCDENAKVKPKLQQVGDFVKSACKVVKCAAQHLVAQVAYAASNKNQEAAQNAANNLSMAQSEFKENKLKLAGEAKGFSDRLKAIKGKLQTASTGTKAQPGPLPQAIEKHKSQSQGR